jgi:tight adherence protein C
LILFLLIGLLLIAAAVGLVGRALVANRLRGSETVAHITAYGFQHTNAHDAAAVAAEAPAKGRVELGQSVGAVASGVGGRLLGRIPGAGEAELRRLLSAAGYYSTPPARFVGYQTISAVVLALLWLLLTATGGSSPLLTIVGMVFGGVIGWVLPAVLLKRKAQQRAEQIDYEMPELIDTLVTTVEAGIAFIASVQIAARRFKGPLGHELRLMLQEQSLGLGLNQALNHLVERCDTPSMRSFARAIIQGELLGVSISDSLRSLSAEMRKRRRAMAEARAQRAPVKMLFPLVFFMLPALFIILLGPAFIHIRTIFQ